MVVTDRWSQQTGGRNRQVVATDRWSIQTGSAYSCQVLSFWVVVFCITSRLCFYKMFLTYKCMAYNVHACANFKFKILLDVFEALKWSLKHDDMCKFTVRRIDGYVVLRYCYNGSVHL